MAGVGSWATFIRHRDVSQADSTGVALPGWLVTSKGRVPELDRLVSKHLLVQALRGKERVFILVVHLLRPIGAQAERQRRQISAVGSWMKAVAENDPAATIIVAGDMNSDVIQPDVSLFGVGREAGELNGFPATHLVGKPFDRLVVAGRGTWISLEIKPSPYGKKPNELIKRLWTDHFFVGASLQTN